MTILEQLKNITLNLRKRKSSVSSIFQFHIAEIENIGKNKGNRVTTEDEVIQYLKKTVQKLKENEYSEEQEISILEGLLPRMATEEEVRAHILHLESTEGLDITNKGAVMKAVKQEFGSLVDMKMVNKML